MQSNEVMRFKKFLKGLINDYIQLIYILAVVSFLCNVIIAIVLGLKLTVHPIIAFLIVTVLILTPVCGVRFLEHEFKIENNIEDDDDY